MKNTTTRTTPSLMAIDLADADLTQTHLTSPKELTMATSRLDRAPHQYLTLPEAAAYVGQSVKTLRRRISAGTLPAYRFGPRSIRVRLADLEATGHRVPSATP